MSINYENAFDGMMDNLDLISLEDMRSLMFSLFPVDSDDSSTIKWWLGLSENKQIEAFYDIISGEKYAEQFNVPTPA